MIKFGTFTLDIQNRQLFENEQRVELNPRYLDALILLIQHRGELVAKDVFFDTVWPGVVVTDDALTQCIKTLRKLLRDSATSPVFIQTVPKHGYRFIAECREQTDPQPAITQHSYLAIAHPGWRLFIGGVAGGALAGLFGGILIAMGLLQLQPHAGAFSTLITITSLTLFMALLGSAGISTGVALSRHMPFPILPIASAAIGGMLVGALVKLVGFDTLQLLTGQVPTTITGAWEGLLLGFSAGSAYWLLGHPGRFRFAISAGVGVLTGACIQLSGGQLMVGSLFALAQQYPNASLNIPPLPPLISLLICMLEALVFTVFIGLGLTLASRSPKD